MSRISIGQHRSQGRPRGSSIVVPTVPGKTPVIFAGHGSFNTRTDAKYPKVRLPPDVTLVFWCHHGEELLNSIGVFVESHRPLSKLPEHLAQQAVKEGYDSTGIPEIVPGGSEIWNYRLTYPSGLSLGNAPGEVKSSMYNRPVTPQSTGRAPAQMPQGVVRDNAYCIVPSLSGDIGDRGVPIIAMIAGYWQICQGNVIHWCACRSIADR